jgi:hypothetical protein
MGYSLHAFRMGTSPSPCRVVGAVVEDAVVVVVVLALRRAEVREEGERWIELREEGEAR